jgi:hypothetical protein
VKGRSVGQIHDDGARGQSPGGQQGPTEPRGGLRPLLDDGVSPPWLEPRTPTRCGTRRVYGQTSGDPRSPAGGLPLRQPEAPSVHVGGDGRTGADASGRPERSRQPTTSAGFFRRISPTISGTSLGPILCPDRCGGRMGLSIRGFWRSGPRPPGLSRRVIFPPWRDSPRTGE